MPKTRLLLWMLFTTPMVVAPAASCSDGGSDTSSGSTSSGTSGDADAGDAGDADAADVSDATEEPMGEAGWVPVGWKAPCKVEVAQHPELAAPKLTWGACPGDAPGCEAVAVTWEKGFGPPLAAVTVVPWGDGYRVGAYLSYPDSEYRMAVFDVDGTPLIAWRAVSPCLGMTPRVGPSRVWFGAQGDSTSAFIVGAYETVASAPEVVSAILPWQDRDSNDTTLSVEGLTGSNIVIYDRLGNQVNSFGPPGLDYTVAHPVNDSALMMAFPAFEKPEAWIWNRSTHTTEPLVQPAPEVVMDIRSDGSTLVWLQVPPKDPGAPYFPPGNLWTSPFATSKAALQPQKRRPISMVGTPTGAAGQGFYAMYGITPDRKIHVYRLEDAQHWEFVPPAETYNIREVSHVDPKYVWYWTVTGVYRQALDALGPGDSPP